MKPYVNLLPTDIQRHSLSMKMSRRWYLLTIGILIIGILALLPYQSAQKSVLAQIHDALPLASRSITIEEKLNNIREKINHTHSVHKQHLVMTGQYPPLAALAVLSEFSSSHPKSIQVSIFDYTNVRFPKREDLPRDVIESAESIVSNKPAVTPQSPADGLCTLVIQAKLKDPTLATALIGKLKASKIFKEVTLLNHSVDREADSYLSTIDLTCKF